MSPDSFQRIQAQSGVFVEVASDTDVVLTMGCVVNVTTGAIVVSTAIIVVGTVVGGAVGGVVLVGAVVAAVVLVGGTVLVVVHTIAAMRM